MSSVAKTMTASVFYLAQIGDEVCQSRCCLGERGCLPFEAYLSDSRVCLMRVNTKLIRTAEEARNIGILLCIEHASVPQMPSYPTLHLHQHCLPQLEETPQQKKSEK